MMNAKKSLLPTGLLIVVLLAATSSSLAQITPSADAYTNSASAGTNFGTAVTLGAANTATSIQKSYIQFDLSSIPSGFKGTNIAKASLKLYVNSVTTAGSFNVDYVTGPWAEKTITGNLSPTIGTTVVGSVPLTSALVHDYVLVDVTPAVVAWLNGTQANDGLALVANSPLNATFDSKENTTQSHAPELDIVFTGGLSGATLTPGGGLAGGVSGGVLSVGLLNTCTSKQVLQWNGTAWACSSSGTGTVTGVTAGTDLTGGGTGGNVTLNLNTTALQTANDARYAQLTATNAFTQPMTVTGTQQVMVKATTSAASASAIYGHSTDTSGIGSSEGVLGVADGPSGIGVFGGATGSGGNGVQANGAKRGVLGFNGSVSSNWDNLAGSIGVQGDSSGSLGVGLLGTADTGFGGWLTNNSPGGAATLVLQNQASTGYLIEAQGVPSLTEALLLDVNGNLSIAGNISKAGGSFKIDHPLDPSNKYLYHSFVESPDMMNIYNGTVVLDAEGRASVTLPDWFEALNRDFRYQLTAIGAPGPNLYISQEVTNNHFEIAGGKPGGKISWQVTGVRHDAWAEAHRIPLEVGKTGVEKGKYLHPELFGLEPGKFGIPSKARPRQGPAAAHR